MKTKEKAKKESTYRMVCTNPRCSRYGEVTKHSCRAWDRYEQYTCLTCGSSGPVYTVR